MPRNKTYFTKDKTPPVNEPVLVDFYKYEILATMDENGQWHGIMKQLPKDYKPQCWSSIKPDSGE